MTITDEAIETAVKYAHQMCIRDSDKGFPKEKRVTWDAVTADQVKDYHSFTVTGHVEGCLLYTSGRNRGPELLQE